MEYILYFVIFGMSDSVRSDTSALRDFEYAVALESFCQRQCGRVPTSGRPFIVVCDMPNRFDDVINID